MSKHKRPPLVDEVCLPGAGIDGVCDRCEAELSTGRRRWCSDDCSAHYYRHHIWQYARNAALRRDKQTCVNGCDHPMLEVDHIKAARGAHSKHACVHHLDNLRTLCVPCHKARTAEQRRAS